MEGVAVGILEDARLPRVADATDDGEARRTGDGCLAAVGGRALGELRLREEERRCRTARHLGAEVLGLSLVSNFAAGVSTGPLNHLEVLETGWTNIQRLGSFLECPADLKPDARRFEAGSLNTNGVYGLRAAIDLLLEIGIENIAAEVIRIVARLADRLDEIGWRVASRRPIASGIVGAIPPGVEPSLLRWHRKLEENGVVCAPREGMLRFSPHFYNDDAEVDRLIELLR